MKQLIAMLMFILLVALPASASTTTIPGLHTEAPPAPPNFDLLANLAPPPLPPAFWIDDESAAPTFNLWAGEIFSWTGGISAVPEPTSLLFLGSGLAGLVGFGLRRH